MKIKSLIFVAVLAIAILCSAGFVNAQITQTQDQLTQQLIQVLEQLIVQLQQKINAILAQQQVTVCTPNWTCGWGQCTNGYQSQVATDSNNCGSPSSNASIACPALARICNLLTNLPPVISGITAPTTLNVGQTGTWTVNAYDQENGSLGYLVNWGDTPNAYPTPANNVSQVPFVQTSTFTHSYATAGAYTVAFTVKDNVGQTVSTSATVQVGGIVNNNLSISYPPDPANWHDYVGGNFSKTFSVVNYSSSRHYIWSVTGGALPPGLIITPAIYLLSCAPMASSCVHPDVSYSINIAGTPTQAGSFTFTLMVKDDLGNTGSINLNVGIENRGSIALKPVIYLYPEKTQTVKVQLDYAGKIIVDYPAYDQKIGGWEVTASPNGKLVNKADGKEYSYLFWEGDNYNKTNYDLSTGFIVKGSDARAFLQTTLSKMGLTPKEYNEFIVYWYPKMQDNAYNLVHFAGQEYTDTAKLTISPTPNSILRVFMVLKSLDQEINILPQEIKPFERKGFTVVEWGGTELAK